MLHFFLSNYNPMMSLLFSSSVILRTIMYKGSRFVDFLRPTFRVAHTKNDVISILINKYTYINM